MTYEIAKDRRRLTVKSRVIDGWPRGSRLHAPNEGNMEYRVRGVVKVYFSTVVDAESAEEAREKVETEYSPEELLESQDGPSEFSVWDVQNES